jgi:voltage-gated potassium channel
MLVFVGPWLILSGQIVSQFWLLCSISLFMLFFPIWRIIDLVVAHFIILFIYSEANIDLSRDGYIRIRHPQRWIAFLAFDFLQIVLSFALVYLFMDIFCSSDNPPFKEHFYTTKHLVSSLESLEIGINSFYFSLVTIVTLGYGDFSPTTYLGRLVVSLEILIGIFFLFFVFVIALPTIRTTNTMGKKWKN